MSDVGDLDDFINSQNKKEMEGAKNTGEEEMKFDGDEMKFEGDSKYLLDV